MGGGLVGFNIEQTFMAQKYERGGRDGRVGGVNERLLDVAPFPSLPLMWLSQLFCTVYDQLPKVVVFLKLPKLRFTLTIKNLLFLFFSN